MFRARNKLLSSDDDSSTEAFFYNCYVSYRESVTASGALYRQAVVLVSRWPCPQLAFQILTKLDEACFWQLSQKEKRKGELEAGERPLQSSTDAAPPSSGVGDLATTQGTAQAMLQSAISQISSWPPPRPNSRLHAAFLGEVFWVFVHVLVRVCVRLSVDDMIEEKLSISMRNSSRMTPCKTMPTSYLSLSLTSYRLDAPIPCAR